MKSSAHASPAFTSSVIILCCSSLYFGLPERGLGQPAVQLETASVEVHLARQLRLTQKDRRALHPLIEWESDELLSLYEFNTDENGLEFLSLWNAVRARRTELVRVPSGRLTRLQERALSLARLDLDSRILEQWLDDYLDMLYERLDLDLVQFKQVQKVFDVEHQKRLNLLREEASRGVRLDDRWNKVRDERELRLELILSEPQLRYYRQLTNPPRFIAAHRETRIHQIGS